MRSDANIVFERHRNELDVTQGGRAVGLGRTAAMIAAGAVVAALFASAPLRDWAFELSFAVENPDSPLGTVSSWILAAAETWHGWMEDLGSAGVYQDVRLWLEGLRYG
ncbi:MAG: hypothetical protein RLO50_06855 [Azospirillaceae bacterium]